MAYLRVVINSLLFPSNPVLQGLRDLALAVSLVGVAGSIGFFQLSRSTIIFGVISMILFSMFLIALAYINHTPDPTSFIVKLVGISLFTLLTIAAWLGLQDIGSLRDGVVRQRMMHAELVRQGMLADNLTLLPPDVLYVVAWPKDVDDLSTIEAHYVRSEKESARQLVLQNIVNVRHVLDIGVRPNREELVYDENNPIAKKNTNRYLGMTITAQSKPWGK